MATEPHSALVHPQVLSEKIELYLQRKSCLAAAPHPMVSQAYPQRTHAMRWY